MTTPVTPHDRPFSGEAPQQPALTPPAPQPKKGLAITALVLGIVAVAGCFIPVLNIVSIIIGFVGLVFGIVAVVLAVKRRSGGRTMGIVGTVLSVLAIIVGISVNVAFATAVDDAVSDGTSISEPAVTGADEDAEADETTEAGSDEAANNEADPSDPGVAVFGETYTYDDGLAVTVSAPEEFTPSEWSIGADGDGTPVKFDITIENGSGETFDPTLVYATVASDGVESEGIYDDEIGSSPSTSVRPGKSVTYTVGYMVADPSDIQMDYSAGAFEYSDITFATE
jgi:hypothetical protein